MVDDADLLIALEDNSSIHYIELGESTYRKLNVYTEEMYETRSLLNNPDLDPDANYFIHRPKETSYRSPSSMGLDFAPSPDQLSLMHINCRSIINKLPDIIILLEVLPVDILAVTETWVDENTTNLVHIPGYTFTGQNRSTGSGGGVGFFIKSNIIFTPMDTNLTHSTYENLFIKFPLPNGSYYTAGVIYRPPGHDLEEFNKDFSLLIAAITKKSKDVFILGDFNIDLLKAQDHTHTSNFLDLLSSNHFLPSIIKPTRITSTSATLIDNILLNTVSKLIDSFIIVTDISDHLPIMIRVNITLSHKPFSTTHINRKFDDVSLARFKSLLNQIDWSSVNILCCNANPDAAYDEFFTKFKDAYNIAFPLIKVMVRRRDKFKNPWMTPGLLKSSRQKEKLYKKYLNNPNSLTKANFTNYRNKFKSLRIKAEKTYYESEFTKYNNDLKKTWRIIRSIINNNNPDKAIDTLCIDGIKITDPLILAEKFNNYFTGLAQSLIDKLPNSTTPFNNYLNSPRPNSFAIIPTTVEELISISHALKTTHSAGLDEIDPSIMHPCINYIAAPLTTIFNCSLSTGIVPSALKIAKIIPILKQGNKEDINNYRPISILPYFSKLLEKLMYNRLYDYVTKMKILFPSQHGFQSGHSTSMALLSIQENISSVIDKNEFSIGIFLDIAKAFDTVDHNILFTKLENIGIRGLVLDWFKDYLTNRKQVVSCQGNLSELMTIKFGVPQGSILGPLLFLLFINDLPNASALANFILFADDSNVFFSDKSYDSLYQTANQELLKIADWFRSNKLSLNLNKTNYILFCSHRKKIPDIQGSIQLNNFIIPQVISVKFLGVHLDQHLTWNAHTSQIASKISKNMGILSKISYLLPTQLRLNLYYSLIHPYLSYCNMIWASNYPTRLVRLTVLQKRAVRIISGSGFSISSSILFQKFKIPQLHQLKDIQICEFMFKYITRTLPSIFHDYFQTTSQVHHYQLRSASHFRGIFARTNSRKFSLKCAGPPIWNSLPLHLKNIISFSLFKTRLRSHILSGCN